jgi:streptogramin lyase
VRSDFVASFPAYWPGGHLSEFLASSAYTTCKDVPLPDDTGTLGRIEFDPSDNLWITGQKSSSISFGLIEALANQRYARFRSFDVGPIAYTLDHEGDVWALWGSLNTPSLPKDLFEITKSSSYTNHVHYTVPSPSVPLDIAVDSGDNVWIPSLTTGPAVQRDLIVLAKKDAYSKPTRFSMSCPVRQVVINHAGQLFASVDFQDSALMELAQTDSRWACTRTIATYAGTQRTGPPLISMDSKDNLWVLGQSWLIHYSDPSHVIELTSASGFSQRKTFMVPRRVFGLTTDRDDDVWVTSPFKNVPYSVGGGGGHALVYGFRPEDVTTLDAVSGYSKQKTLVVPGWPFGIATDRSGNIWIANGNADSDNVVELLASADFAKQKTFDVPGNAYGVAVDSRGNVWVTGRFPQDNVVELSQKTGYGIARKLRIPGRAQGIAFDPDDNLWVGDFQHTESNLIQFFAGSDYRESRRYTVNGSPYALAFDKSGNLWSAVAGCPQDRIAQLLKSSDYAKEIAYPVDGRPYGVTVDARGNVWGAVATEPKSEVKELARSAGYSQTRRFEIPGYRTFAVDSRGNVWVQSFDYVETDALTGVRRYAAPFYR